MGDTLNRLAQVIDPDAWGGATVALCEHRQAEARRKIRAVLRQLRNSPNESSRLGLISASACMDGSAVVAWETMIDAILERRD